MLPTCWHWERITELDIRSSSWNKREICSSFLLSHQEGGQHCWTYVIDAKTPRAFGGKISTKEDFILTNIAQFLILEEYTNTVTPSWLEEKEVVMHKQFSSRTLNIFVSAARYHVPTTKWHDRAWIWWMLTCTIITLNDRALHTEQKAALRQWLLHLHVECITEDSIDRQVLHCSKSMTSRGCGVTFLVPKLQFI